MINNLLFSVFLIFLVSGCTTIYFDNGPAPIKNTQTSEWTHSFNYSFLEKDSPINMKQECNNKKWISVKTEFSFFSNLANGAVAILATIVAGAMVGPTPIWHPKTVKVLCDR